MFPNLVNHQNVGTYSAPNFPPETKGTFLQRRHILQSKLSEDLGLTIFGRHLVFTPLLTNILFLSLHFHFWFQTFFENIINLDSVSLPTMGRKQFELSRRYAVRKMFEEENAQVSSSIEYLIYVFFLLKYILFILLRLKAG